MAVREADRSLGASLAQATPRVWGLGAVALLFLAFPLAGISGCGGEKSHPEPSRAPFVRLRLEADSLGVGDPFIVRWQAAWPSSLGSCRLVWDLPPDVAVVLEVDSTGFADGQAKYGISLAKRLIAIRGGELELPPAALVDALGDTLAVSERGRILVGTRLDASAAPEPRGLAPMVPLGHGFWPAAAIGAGALLLIALMVILLLRRSREAAEVTETPPPPPLEEFEKALESLLEQRLAEQGLMREYVQRLSWILRRYMGRRWSRPALEATRPEILSWLPEVPIPVSHKAKISSWLEETDAIKFAGRVPLLSEVQRLTEEAREFVRVMEDSARREEQEVLRATGTEGAVAGSPGEGGLGGSRSGGAERSGRSPGGLDTRRGAGGDGEGGEGA